MTSVGIMASSVVTAVCTDVLSEPFDNFALWTITSNCTIVTGRTGTGCSIVGSGATQFAVYSIPGANESAYLMIGFAFRISNATGTRTMFRLSSDGDTTTHIFVHIPTDGSVVIRNGGGSGPILATAPAGTIPINTYVYVEFAAYLHATAGYVTMQANGTQVAAATNVATKTSGTKTTFDAVRLLGPNSGITNIYDDLYISTGAGCSFKGDQTIVAPGPVPMTNLQLWLDTDDASTFTYSSGTVVSQWTDKSGNSRHAVQATVANQPSRSGTQNGRPTVVFTGASQTLATATPATTQTLDWTIVVACVRTGGGTQSVVVMNGQATDGYGVGLRANGPNVGFLRGNIAWTATTTPDPAAPAVLVLMRSSVGGNWWMFMNGVSLSFTGTVAPSAPAVETRLASTVHRFQGEIYEVLIYNRELPTTDRQQVESYLKAKWGTP